MNSAPSLIRLAELNGVQASFLDMAGKRHFAAPEVLTAVLAALGVPARSDAEIRESLRETRLKSLRRALEPAVVAWDRRAAKIKLHLPEPLANRRLEIRLHFEDGRVERIVTHFRKLNRIEVRGERFVTREFTLPVLPHGYHILQISADSRVYQTLIISAPSKSYSDLNAARTWGAFLPMYAAHSKRSWGAGNISDFGQLSDEIASLGGGVIATLPLLGAFLDFPNCEPSPYSPASRLFWNEFYIDIERVPEFENCAPARELVRSDAFQRQLRAFRCTRQIDYSAQWNVRRRVLELLAQHFLSTPSPRRRAFEQFVREHPRVKDYAAFRATCDRRKTSWHTWPARLREGKLRAGDFEPPMRDFHLYTQWLIHEQMDELAARCNARGVKLYLDLPLGVNPDGYDVWRERDSFAMGASAGAPPDLFFAKGQDWGFAPFHPQRIRETGYRHLRDILRFQMPPAGLLRIDHVMGLHRLYWIPRGCSAAEGIYVRYPAAELHAIFNLESHRHRTQLVGENLGTIPESVRRSMKRHRIREMFVVQYEQRPDPKSALRTPPALSIASLNTHDMPTFAAHWKGADLADRADLGLIPHSNLPAERHNRKRLSQALTKYLSARKFLMRTATDAPDVLRALLAWLGASPAEIVLVTLEDLWLETQPQNTPGTTTERPNWRHKARLAIEEIQRDPKLRETLSRIAELRKGA